MKQSNVCGGKALWQNQPQRGDVMGPTETCSMTNTKLARIAWLSAHDPGKRFDHLMHHFTEESLAACFHALDGN